MIEHVRPVEDAQPSAVEVAAFRRMLASGKAFTIRVSDEANGECERLCLSDGRWPSVVNECWWGGTGVWYMVPARK